MTTIVLTWRDQRIEKPTPEAEETVFRGVTQALTLEDANSGALVRWSAPALELINPAGG